MPPASCLTVSGWPPRQPCAADGSGSASAGSRSMVQPCLVLRRCPCSSGWGPSAQSASASACLRAAARAPPTGSLSCPTSPSRSGATRPPLLSSLPERCGLARHWTCSCCRLTNCILPCDCTCTHNCYLWAGHACCCWCYQHVTRLRADVKKHCVQC